MARGEPGNAGFAREQRVLQQRSRMPRGLAVRKAGAARGRAGVIRAMPTPVAPACLLLKFPISSEVQTENCQTSWNQQSSGVIRSSDFTVRVAYLLTSYSR